MVLKPVGCVNDEPAEDDKAGICWNIDYGVPLPRWYPDYRKI